MFRIESSALALAVLYICIGPTASKATITTFDPPGSSGTYALAINAGGAVAGYYTDEYGIAHGYRTACIELPTPHEMARLRPDCTVYASWPTRARVVPADVLSRRV